MPLNPASVQQKAIIAALSTSNVSVNAVAGAGKTTTALHIAKHYTQQSILLLTYNAKLKSETRSKIKELSLSNLEAHSYHAFCVNYYGKEYHTDTKLKQLLKKQLSPLKPFRYDIVIIDEAQDMTLLYFQLITKIFKDNSTSRAKLCIIGDKYQSIYGFMGADTRFLTKSQEVFANFNTFEWKNNLELSTSYRITPRMAIFINKCMYQVAKPFITSGKPFFPQLDEAITTSRYYSELEEYQERFDLTSNVHYLICNSLGVKSKVFLLLEEILNTGRYSPDDIMVLAPSIKSNKSPIRVLEQDIMRYIKDVPVHAPACNGDKVDENIVKGKILLSSFHQAKGLERKIVFVLGFDESYFTFYNKSVDRSRCPNELYVAATRASECLILVHHSSQNYLPFLADPKTLRYHAMVSGELRVQATREANPPVKVTELLRHLTIDTVSHCMSYFTLTTIRPASTLIRLAEKTQQHFGGKPITEPVAALNGIAIPLYLQLLRDNSIKSVELATISHRDIIAKFGRIRDTLQLNKKKKLQNILSPADLLYVANIVRYSYDRFISRVLQITNYDWLDQETLDQCLRRLESLELSEKSRHEVHSDHQKDYYGCSSFTHSLKDSDDSERVVLSKDFKWAIDCIDQNRIFEFKCTSKLEDEHFLQLALYAYCYKYGCKSSDEANTMQYFCYNILTNELVELVFNSPTAMDEMVDFLVREKYAATKPLLEDQAFFAHCLDVSSSLRLVDE